MYFTADRVEKVSGDKIVIINGEVTACGDDEVPKWSFKTARATIKLADRVQAQASRACSSRACPSSGSPTPPSPSSRATAPPGFLTPTFSGSGEKGFRLSNAYYQTLGPLGRHHLPQRHLHEARHRLRRRPAHARQLALVPQHGLLHGQGSHLRPEGGRRRTPTRAARASTLTASTTSRTAFSPPPTSTSLRTSPSGRSSPTRSSSPSRRRSARRSSSTRTSAPTPSTSSRARRSPPSRPCACARGSLPGISFEKRPGPRLVAEGQAAASTSRSRAASRA